MIGSEIEVSEVQAALAEGYKSGAKAKLEEVIKKIDNRICFDHLDSGTCDHGQCWGLRDLKLDLLNLKG